MVKVEEVVGKIITEWLRIEGLEAENAGRLVFVAPKGLLNKIRLKMALFLFPRETMVMGIPDFGSQPKEDALLRRLGIPAFPGYDGCDQEKNLSKQEIKNPRGIQDKERKLATPDLRREHGAK